MLPAFDPIKDTLVGKVLCSSAFNLDSSKEGKQNRANLLSRIEKMSDDQRYVFADQINKVVGGIQLKREGSSKYTINDGAVCAFLYLDDADISKVDKTLFKTAKDQVLRFFKSKPLSKEIVDRIEFLYRTIIGTTTKTAITGSPEYSLDHVSNVPGKLNTEKETLEKEIATIPPLITAFKELIVLGDTEIDAVKDFQAFGALLKYIMQSRKVHDMVLKTQVLGTKFAEQLSITLKLTEKYLADSKKTDFKLSVFFKDQIEFLKNTKLVNPDVVQKMNDAVMNIEKNQDKNLNLKVLFKTYLSTTLNRFNSELEKIVTDKEEQKKLIEALLPYFKEKKDIKTKQADLEIAKNEQNRYQSILDTMRFLSTSDQETLQSALPILIDQAKAEKDLGLQLQLENLHAITKQIPTQIESETWRQSFKQSIIPGQLDPIKKDLIDRLDEFKKAFPDAPVTGTPPIPANLHLLYLEYLVAYYEKKLADVKKKEETLQTEINTLQAVIIPPQPKAPTVAEPKETVTPKEPVVPVVQAKNPATAPSAAVIIPTEAECNKDKVKLSIREIMKYVAQNLSDDNKAFSYYYQLSGKEYETIAPFVYAKFYDLLKDKHLPDATEWNWAELIFLKKPTPNQPKNITATQLNQYRLEALLHGFKRVSLN